MRNNIYLVEISLNLTLYVKFVEFKGFFFSLK